MRTDSPLVLDVRELLEHPRTPRPITFDARVPELGAGLVQVQDDVHFDLTLEAIDGGVFVRGRFSGLASGECRRCLKPVAEPFDLEGAELYRPPSDVWEEGYAIKDTTIDLEPMVRDTVILNLPTSPLCREDCAGLCTRCGADLNEGDCGCSEEIDTRWSALQDLLATPKPPGTTARGGGGNGSAAQNG